MQAVVQARAGYMGRLRGHAQAQTGPYQLWLLLGTPELYPDSVGRRVGEEREQGGRRHSRDNQDRVPRAPHPL